MAISATVGSNTHIKKVVVSGSTTQVKKVVVGTPVKRVTSGVFNIDNLSGVSTVGAINGSVLIYNADEDIWKAEIDLQNQNINGGIY